jgi:hypothetical protein
MRGVSRFLEAPLMFEIVAVVFAIGVAVALFEWWNGPDIPRS